MIIKTIDTCRRWTAFAALFAALCVIQSCGPGAPREETTAAVAPELRQRLVPDVTAAHVLKTEFDLTWDTHRRRSDIIRGYNVYVSTRATLSKLPDDSPALKDALYNASTYPGDTDGEIGTETIHIENLTSGTRYFVHVRTVFPDGSMGLPSRELEVIPRPRGQLILCPRTGNCEGGYSFRLDAPVERYSDDNDLYIYQTKTDVFVASPSRLDRSLRRTMFSELGPSNSLDDHPRFAGDLSGEDKFIVRKGYSLAVVLTGDRIAKLRPLEVELSGDSPRVVFEYLYQPLSGELTF